MALTKDSTILKPIYENIPDELKQLNHWVCWKAVERKGKITKVPYQANGKFAKSDNKNTWNSFAAVKHAFETSAARFDGIGFMLGEGIIGIDIDGCIDEIGTINEYAQAILKSVDSYHEVSVSGTGLHILVKGDLPGGYMSKNTKLDLEVYGGMRYFTITGVTFSTPKPLKQDQTGIINILNQYFKKDETQKNPKSPQRGNVSAPDLSNSELWVRMFKSKNGQSLQALYNGDLSYHNGDHSAADQALCNALAFWTDKDPFRMDSMFRETALMRDKWDEMRGIAPYGALTIEKAIRDTQSTISDYKKPSVANDFKSFDSEIIPLPFSIEKNALYKTVIKKVDGFELEQNVMVARLAPKIMKELSNIERNSVHYELAWTDRGQKKHEVVSASTIATKKELLTLADKGLPVNDLNYKDLINYFDKYLAVNRLSQSFMVERLGHIRDAFIHPLNSQGIEIVPNDIGEKQILEAFQVSGTVETWKTEVFDKIKNHKKVLFLVLSSFASVILSDLKITPFIVDLSGSTSQGKTTALQVARTVWGTEGLLSEWNATKVSIERKTAFLNNFPLFMDDTRKADERILQSIVYQFSGGRSKGRGSVKGSQMELTWNNILISTGEVSLTDYSGKAGGAAARIIPLEDEPFKSIEDNYFSVLYEAMENNYGTIGLEFLNKWQAEKKNLIPDFHNYKNYYLRKSKGNEVLTRLSLYYAAVIFAGSVVQKLLNIQINFPILDKLFDEIAGENKAIDKPKQLLEEILLKLDMSRRDIYYDQFFIPNEIKAIYKFNTLCLTPAFLKDFLGSEEKMVRKEWLKRGFTLESEYRGKVVDYKQIKHDGKKFNAVVINPQIIDGFGLDFSTEIK